MYRICDKENNCCTDKNHFIPLNCRIKSAARSKATDVIDYRKKEDIS